MKNKNKRMMRIDDEIKKCLAKILELKKDDLKIEKEFIVSVTKVEATKDLQWCKVYISVLCEEKRRDALINILNDSEKLIRKLVAQKLNLRLTPKFIFVLDDRIEYAMKTDNLLKKL